MTAPSDFVLKPLDGRRPVAVISPQSIHRQNQTLPQRDMHNIPRQMFMAIINLLRGYRRSFNALERAILDEVQKAIPEHVRQAFAQRLISINMVQPILGGQEINLYERRNGKILFGSDGRLVSADASILIATVELRSADEISCLTARLFCGNGVLTSLEFNLPSEHADIEKVSAMTVSITPETPWI